MLHATSNNDTPKTLTDAVYAQIRNDIIDGRLAPDSKLRIEHLKSTYSVGATPIREALSRLSSDGFVYSEGQRGFTVTPVSIDDLLEITELRLMLELKALTQSITAGDEDWEARIVSAFFRLSKAESGKKIDDMELWERRNREFHDAVLSACSSKWLLRFYRIIYDQHKRYRNISINESSNPVRSVHQEHERIYNAVLARDIKTACSEVEIHIRKTADISIEWLQKHFKQLELEK